MRVVVVGCGWLGLPLAARYARDGHDVHGTTTRAARVDALREQGVTPHLLRAGAQLDGDAAVLGGADRVVIAVPPSGTADGYPEAIARLAQAAADAGGIVHCSSTGVYPDRSGHPVTREPDVAERPTPRAARLLAAEAAAQATSAPVAILRLGGLWGYGRHPVRFLAGRERPGGDAPVNLIHRDDVIDAVRAVASEPFVEGVFSVVADPHPTRAAFYTAEAERLGLEPPRFAPGPSGGKRVVADRLRDATGWRARWRPGDPAAP